MEHGERGHASNSVLDRVEATRAWFTRHPGRDGICETNDGDTTMDLGKASEQTQGQRLKPFAEPGLPPDNTKSTPA
jgi:hypothetical protein